MLDQRRRGRENQGGGRVGQKDVEKREGSEKGDGEDDDPEPDADEKGPDGFSRPIPVLEGQFVCRLRKRERGFGFDRIQTDNWYSSTLGEVFPEVGLVGRSLEGTTAQGSSSEMQQNPKDAAKAAYQRSTMNLRRTLYVGESSEPAGLLKGMMRVTEVGVDVT